VKTVATYSEEYRAEMLRGRLQTEGIDAVVEPSMPRVFVGFGGFSGIRVEVPDEQFEAARAIVEAIESEQGP
jgi:hypothetical protein